MLRRPANARPGFELDVKIVGQDASFGSGTTLWAKVGHASRIAPTWSWRNDPCLRHSPPCTDSDKNRFGAFVKRGAVPLTLNLDRLRATCWAGDRRSRPQPRSGGAERASLDGLAAVRPARAQAVMAQLAFRDSVSGRSNSTRSCITLGVIRPRSPRSRRTRP